MSNRFAYTDETDKCYGITGMVVSLNILDSDLLPMRICIDEDESDYMQFEPGFNFIGNPRFSAKTAWKETVKQYQLLVGMALGNLLCRSYGYRHTAPQAESIHAMHDIVADEGRRACSLDDDEIDVIFRKTLNYMDDVYSNRSVATIVDGFVKVLKRRRSLTAGEIADELDALRR